VEWARLVLDYVDSLAWPLVVLILVVVFALLFRKNIANLIENAERVAGAGFEVTFSQKLLALNVEANEAQLPSAPVPISLEPRPVLGDEFEHTPHDNYRGVVLGSWVEVEHALIEIGDSLNLDLGSTPSAARIVNELEKQHLLTVEAASVIRSARDLRNEAAHATAPLSDETSVKTYVGMTGRIVRLLKLVEENAEVIQAAVKGAEDAGEGEA